MTNLYIRIVNGVAVEYPIIEENLLSAYPEIAPDALPAGFARFQKTPRPVSEVYELIEFSHYTANDEGVYTEAWTVRPMTDDEKLARQNFFKSQHAQMTGWVSWVFDEETCRMVPPVEKPENVPSTVDTPGIIYKWDEPTVSWIAEETPVLPAPLLSPEDLARLANEADSVDDPQ
jgi:hypothetical protein